MNRVVRYVAKSFGIGVVILAPVIVTFLAVKFIFERLDSIFPYAKNLPYVPDMPGVSIGFVIVIIIIVGIVGGNVLGKKFVHLVQQATLRIPGIKSIYSPTKQIAEALKEMKGKTGTQQVVLIEYPMKDRWTLGLRVSRTKIDGKPYSAVTFLSAITLQPISTILVPDQEVKEVTLSMNQFATFTVSAGFAGIETITTKKIPDL